MEVSDPLGEIISKRNLDAFVDYVNAGLIQTGWMRCMGSNRIPKCINIAQQAELGIQYYSDILEA